MYKKNTAGNITFVLINATTGAALTGATVAGHVTLDQAAQTAVTGTFTEQGLGQYLFKGATADFNANDCGFLFTASSAVPVNVHVHATGADVTDGVRLGLTAMPNTACSTNASLLTSGTGTDQLSVASGRVDLGKVLGTASAGVAGYVGIDWAHINAPTTTVAFTGTTISTSSFPANFAALGITAGGKISEVALCDTLTTYTGNTPQTGDSFARLGAPAGASTAADIAAVNAKTTNLPASPADESLVIAATTSIFNRIGAPTGASIAADIQTRSTYAGADTSGTTTLLTRLGGNLTISGGKVAATLATSDVTGNLPANVTQVAGQSASAAGAVTFPSSIGTSTYAGGAVASVTATVNATLVATGLDAISVADPGAASNWTTLPKVLVAMYRKLLKKTDLTKTGTGTATEHLYANDGTTVNATQALTDDGTTQTQGAAT